MKESILIINSDDTTEKLLEVFFTRKGFIVYKAEHGLKAFRILNNNNISVIIYELISEELAEFGFLEYIRKKHSAIQVIVISEIAEINLALTAMKNGAYDFITKPIEEERLIFTITRAISEKKENDHKISTDKRNREYQKILMKELELTKRELEGLREDLAAKKLELELIYGPDYNKENESTVPLGLIRGKERIGKYTILEEIGKGGMSIVYKAIDHILNRDVAIKELTIIQKKFPKHILEDLTKRFFKEAQVIAMLRHDNIVKVFDIIEEKNKHYIIMEYIDGKTLDKLISGNRKIPVLEAVNIVTEICLALEYIHNNNIIHRDIKPSNIIIGNDRVVKLMDFGVIRDTSVSTVTPTGAIVGTIAYTAPEQSSKNMDYRVDIFSLGIILYELITGINPFESDTYADTFLKISAVTPPDEPSTINPECDKNLDHIIFKAIEKNPENRYLSAKEFYNDLINFSHMFEISIA
jgi:FixJ family two-component response regulator/tRNA A-37 threonylcarbamoyl transferase component Bud32